MPDVRIQMGGKLLVATDFTTWTALRTTIKNAIADHIAGSPCTGEYAIGNRRMKYRTYAELIDLLEKTYELEALEQSGNPATMVSYGRARRFK